LGKKRESTKGGTDKTKRFTETTKWGDPWFMDLPVKYKAFWFYICDQCDCAGTWEPNIRLAIAQIGESFELTEILRIFAGRIRQLPDGKFWIKDFIPFQYGILSRDCKPHTPVITRLEKLKLIEEYPEAFKQLRVSKGFGYPLDTLQEKEKEKVQEKEGGVQRGIRPMTKYGIPLPARCTIREKDAAVLDYTGRVMDINQIRKASKSEAA
jgi:hypothetical protein